MIRVFFGDPGCGKTTLACKRAKQAFRKGYDHAYLNFENTVPGVHSCNLDRLGLWTFKRNSLVVIDESGIEYNSRKYKDLPQFAIAWYKKHRHYDVNIDLYSQAWDDMDKILRNLSVEYWVMYRRGPWTLCRRMYKRFSIDPNTKQPISEFRLASQFWLWFWFLQYIIPGMDKKFTLTFRPFYYKYFDSWETDDLSVKEFPIHNPRKVRIPFWKKKCQPAAELDSAPVDIIEDLSDYE